MCDVGLSPVPEHSEHSEHPDHPEQPEPSPEAPKTLRRQDMEENMGKHGETCWVGRVWGDAAMLGSIQFRAAAFCPGELRQQVTSVSCMRGPRSCTA